MENTLDTRICTAETLNAEVLKIADMIKAGQSCTDAQQALLAQAICDAYKSAKDYTAEQVSKVAKVAVDTQGKVVELQEAIKKIEPAINLLTNIDATTLEKLTAIQDILSNDNIALQSLLSLKLEVSAIKDSIVDVKSDVTAVKADVITIKDDIIKLQDAQQSDTLCKVTDAFSTLANSLNTIFNCDARTAKTNEALACVTTPYTPVGEYQWAGNPVDLAPSMTIPVLDTVVTPVDVVVPAMPEVIAPTPEIELVYVVTSRAEEGVLFEELSNGNMRKTDIDGTITTTNSMGDLV